MDVLEVYSMCRRPLYAVEPSGVHTCAALVAVYHVSLVVLIEVLPTSLHLQLNRLQERNVDAGIDRCLRLPWAMCHVESGWREHGVHAWKVVAALELGRVRVEQMRQAQQRAMFVLKMHHSLPFGVPD